MRIKMKQLLSIMILTIIPMTYNGCGEPVHSPGSSEMPSTGISAEAFAVFQAGLYPILSTNCGACHGAGQAPLFAVSNAVDSQSALLRLGLVNFTNPANSQIVLKINAGHQGFTAALGTQVTAAISDWAAAVAIDPGGGDPLPMPEPLTATFKSISERILGPKCVACHGAVKADDGIRYDTYALTISTGGVNKTTPTQSKLYTEVLSGSMPRGVGATALTNEEVGVILQWIQGGALNN